MLPLLVGTVQIWGSLGAQRGQVHPGDPLSRVPLDPLGFALLVAGPLALTLRRSRPVLTLWTVAAVTVLYVYLGYSYGPAFLGMMVALFHAVQTGHRRAAYTAGGTLWLCYVAYATWVLPTPMGLFPHAGVGSLILVVLTIAEVARARREQRAERERVSREEARRQASEERLSMARELHDVLGHSISLIHVQASTALHLMDEHPEQARTALTTIKQASKDVLTEMRSLLGVLREDAPRSPTADLSQLDDLVERTGPWAAKRVTGAPRPLPPGVERAAYRIVQESLTNVAKHAPGARATVTLEYGPERLAVRVEDTGAGVPGTLSGEGGGNGIPGMRERAAALGGTLTAGPHASGFRVEALLPIPPQTLPSKDAE
ncbi:two-component sensor histidine kinase [Sphaerisporangium melleum]|uniref:histidine kinase n=2 Tax=Sphaerisporangium melleum TaxID=321316 RepID=A0A917RF46_9ACTN|nr:two-component sensor histidine kinase [Sphaerisporangium melleum]GII73881.1 two-component sensor histidine kinase [Sphaerisporangium melleum]